MYSQELSANKNGVQVLEPSGYYVIDNAWSVHTTPRNSTQNFHIEYIDFEALFDHNHTLNEIYLLEAPYQST